jgi:hypothetical protein
LALIPRKTGSTGHCDHRIFSAGPDILCRFSLNWQKQSPEKTGNLRKFPEVNFLRRKSVPHRSAATRQVANRKKAENPLEK